MFIISQAFWDGFSRAFDLHSVSRSFPDYSNGFVRDRKALRGDWIKVGKSIQHSMEIYNAQRKEAERKSSYRTR